MAPDTRHVWGDGAPRSQGDAEVIGEWLGWAVRRINGKILEQWRFGLGSKPEGRCKQENVTV